MNAVHTKTIIQKKSDGLRHSFCIFGIDLHIILWYNKLYKKSTERGIYMLAVNYSTIRENLKSYCDKVTDNNETVIVTRKDEKNVVIISLNEWNELQRALRNAEYLGRLNRSIADVKAGRGVVKTMDELEALANE